MKGYKAHQYRSTLKQGIDRVMKRWAMEAPPDHPLYGYVGEVFSECVLDHARPDLGYQDLRGHDGQPTYRFEQIVAVAVDEWWEELWQDGPNVRRGLDPHAVEQALGRVRALEADLEMLTARRSECERREGELLRQALQAADDSAKVGLFENARAMTEEKERLHSEATHQAERLAAAREALSRACNEDVLLPVDEKDGSYEARLARVLAAVRQTPAPQETSSEEALADELTVDDIAALYSRTPQHVGRWRKGISNPPLDPQHWRKVNGKQYRYPVAAIDEAALATVPAEDQRRALDEIRRKRARVGFRGRVRGSADRQAA